MMDAFMGFDPRRAAKFAGLGALVLFLCWQHVQATRLGYRVESARRHAREVRSRVADMRLRVDETLSPGALAARASSRLGMIPAEPHALRILPEKIHRSNGLLPRFWARGFQPLAAPARS